MKFDWHTLFVPSGSILEIIVRGACVYFGLFILFRLILKRQSGGFSISDLLVVVLIADAVQNGMAGEYKSITEALVLGATLMSCDYLVDWLEFRFPGFSNLTRPQARCLISNGHLNRENMRIELVSTPELMQTLREQGIESISQVRSARMENDGKISVIRK